MPYVLPRESFNVLVGGAPWLAEGWRSNYALAVAGDPAGGFCSVMLLSGGVLARGFAARDDAHAFNLLATAEPKLRVGTSDLQEFYREAGGVEEAQKLVAKIKKKILVYAALGEPGIPPPKPAGRPKGRKNKPKEQK